MTVYTRAHQAGLDRLTLHLPAGLRFQRPLRHPGSIRIRGGGIASLECLPDTVHIVLRGATHRPTIELSPAGLHEAPGLSARLRRRGAHTLHASLTVTDASGDTRNLSSPVTFTRR